MKRLEKQLLLLLLLLGGVIYGQFRERGYLNDVGSRKYLRGFIRLIRINGPTNVGLNSTYTYKLIPMGSRLPKRGTWQVSGGIIINSSATRATIKWTSLGSKQITYRGRSGSRSFMGINNVTVKSVVPSTPSVPTISQDKCGGVVLSRGTPPSGVTWYWQGTNSNGTTASNSYSGYTVTSSGRYYLRARNNSSGLWSTSSSSIQVTVKTVPSTPSAATLTKNCGSTVLTKGSQPGGITWYWQSSASGTSTSNSSSSITRTSGSVYYLRARNNSTGCWSPVRTVSYSINTVPSTPSAATVTKNCGNTVLTKGSQPGGITYYWQ
ncbi:MULTISPECIES: hypothetical protein, partial [unclassified Tenacibaculum]|uniref:hypothetical protein n=1 Tax=unclassified Tenacibaculum TaxID=2635139 RepID=UPI001EF7F783